LTFAGFFSNDLVIPEPLYSIAKRVLKIGFYNEVRCDTNATIALHFDDFMLSIGPDVYIDQASNVGGVCNGRIVESDDGLFRLPISYMNKKCFSLDYKSKKIGFATAVAIV
jgi:hypothetical protein